MGILDFFRRKPTEAYAPTEVTKALGATLPLWNNLSTKYPQTPRAIYENSPTTAAKLANDLEVGIDTLLKGLAGAQRKNQEVDSKEKETLQNRLKIFRVKKELLHNLIATRGVTSRR